MSLALNHLWSLIFNEEQWNLTKFSPRLVLHIDLWQSIIVDFINRICTCVKKVRLWICVFHTVSMITVPPPSLSFSASLTCSHFEPFVTIKKRERRCPWCNGYRRRKLTRHYEFKSWTRLIAFHITLIPLGKVWIQLFSLQLWVNSRTDYVLQPWLGN